MNQPVDLEELNKNLTAINHDLNHVDAIVSLIYKQQDLDSLKNELDQLNVDQK